MSQGLKDISAIGSAPNALNVNVSVRNASRCILYSSLAFHEHKTPKASATPRLVAAAVQQLGVTSWFGTGT